MDNPCSGWNWKQNYLQFLRKIRLVQSQLVHNIEQQKRTFVPNSEAKTILYDSIEVQNYYEYAWINCDVKNQYEFVKISEVALILYQNKKGSTIRRL